MAAEALRTGGPFPGPDKTVLVETGVPYATHMSVLSDALGRVHQVRLMGQRICFRSGDSAASDTMVVPWGIYPLQPAQCAGLIADVLVLYFADEYKVWA
ncbi:hypothetical protein ACF1HJ_40455 [Streptomyces sp. NPDC013978]|uniref:hypothetical protein n=1 Tax=Streptomyces sp. NPDC013978 TaxID=3364869 RepID=UPI0036FD2B67